MLPAWIATPLPATWLAAMPIPKPLILVAAILAGLGLLAARAKRQQRNQRRLHR
jgi:hypothetical protein